MRYLSVCSGIEAASVAWHPLGWTPVGFSEIEAFPSAVLAHHYPSVPNFGDMTQHETWPIERGAIDVLVGGTPCQSFSVAGLRKGLSDPRGNLALVYLGVLDRLRPRWCVWENVPGVLPSSGGRDFGAFLGALGQLGYGFAYRVLDAQWYGVAQRRRRVFVVGHLGDWRRAAAVLFERESLLGHPAPSREARKEAARVAPAGARGDGAKRERVGPSNRGSHGDDPALAHPTLNQSHNGYSDQELFSQRGAGLVPIDTTKNMASVGFQLTTGNRLSPQTRGLIYVREDDCSLPILTKGSVSGAQGGNLIVSAQRGAGLVPGNAGAVAFQSNHSNGAVGTDDLAPCMAVESNLAVALPPSDVPSDAPFVFDRANVTAKTNRTRVSPKGPVNTLAVGTDLHVVSFKPSHFTRGKDGAPSDISPPLSADADKGDQDTLIYQESEFGVRGYESAGTLRAGRIPEHQMVVQPGQAMREPVPLESRMQVRRLTPVECERLQGFPDGYSAIPVPGRKQKDGTVVTRPAANGPRYKALGNSMAVPVMRWIGQRIALVDSIR